MAIGKLKLHSHEYFKTWCKVSLNHIDTLKKSSNCQKLVQSRRVKEKLQSHLTTQDPLSLFRELIKDLKIKILEAFLYTH